MQQDYLLRMIQQLSLFMAGVLHKRSSGDLAGAEAELEQGYGRFTGLSPTLIHAISEDDLIHLLTARGGIDVERGFALAEILREEAQLYDEAGREAESWPRYLKSLRLYLEVVELDEELAKRDLPGLEQVVERLSGYQLPPVSVAKLAAYHESTGDFDRAENLLVDRYERSEITADELASFYQRLLLREGAALIVGGLTRDEVTAALRELLTPRVD